MFAKFGNATKFGEWIMQVTEIRIFMADEDRLKAYVTVTFDDCFVVRDLKIINGNSGLFVAMPSKKKKDGSYKDIAHPVHSQFRNYLEDLILKKFQEELKAAQNGLPVRRVGDEDEYFDTSKQSRPPLDYPASLATKKDPLV